MQPARSAIAMSRRDRIEWLLTAIRAVEDLVQPKLEARRKAKADGGAESEHDQDLQICIEELRVAAEELIHLRDVLELERQRYAELFDFAPEAYLETDAHWNIREANRAAAKLLCCAQDHLVGKPLVVFVPEGERRHFRAMLATLEKKGADGPVDWGAKMQARDGEAVEVLVRAAAARGADGRVAGVRCMLRARKRRAGDESARESR